MDRTKKIRIVFIVLGLFIAVTGLYLQFIYYHYTTYLSLILFAGAGIAIAAYRYKEGDKLFGVKRKEPKVKISSFRGITILTVLVIFFIGLAFGYIGTTEHNTVADEIFLIFLFMTVILTIVLRFVKAEKKN